jgi:ligand-binding SRPBCC domain-containing protein
VRAHVLEREQPVPRPLDEVFPFFARARNLERITPPWLRFEVLTPEPVELRPGAQIEYRLRLHGVPIRWLTRIERFEPGRGFVDRQVRGPYRLWVHRHEFEPRGGSTLVRDRVRYVLPFGIVGAAAHLAIVRRELARIFDFRAAAVARIFQSL